MSTEKIPTPAEAAAANRLKREKAEKTQKLLDLCLAATTDYLGEGCVSFVLEPQYVAYVESVQLQLTGWVLLVHDGKLYLGTQAEIDRVRPKAAPERPTPPVGHIPGPPATTLPLPPVTSPPDYSKPPAKLPTLPPPPATTLPLPGEESTAPQVVSAVPAEPKPAPPKEIESRTFSTQTVTPEKEPLPTMTAQQAFERLLLTKVEAYSTNGKPLIQANGFHGLIETAHWAFAKHYGLELTPDDLWITIAQGFARIVNQEPESFRDKFVTHAGKQELRIIRNSFTLGNPDNDWAGCFAEFSTAIRAQIGDTNHKLLVPNFSTTGDLERAVSDVVLMDTLQSYFQYRVSTLCGIPFVTLLGSTADWAELAQKTRALSQFGNLDWWLNDVNRILNQFVLASQGTVDPKFWNSIYKFRNGSGGTRMTGWLLKLLPFTTERESKVLTRNRILGQADAVPHTYEKPSSRWGNEDYRGVEFGHRDVGLHSAELTASLSTVPFVWDYLGTDYNYQFVAGIVGSTQNRKNLALRPQLGWAVRPEPKKK